MEMLYQHMWKSGICGRHMTLADGRRLEVLNPGVHNRDSGPDFFNARLRIDGCEWAGDVEVHVRASDWHRHGHSADHAYDSVALHVVAVNDKPVTRRDGSPIPTVEMAADKELIHRWSTLAGKEPGLRCEPWITELTRLARADWLESLGMERLQSKARRLADTLRLLNGDWEQTCFTMLARALGFGLNSEPMEMTARSLPISTLAYHSGDSMQLEALILGQAGLLDPAHDPDDYARCLNREYTFLARKYSLRPLPRSVWKLARTRPHNFPQRRLAQLAAYCLDGFRLTRRLLDAPCDAEALRTLLRVHDDGYWSRHYTFGRPAPHQSAGMTDASLDTLLINFVAPFYYAYGSLRGDEAVAGRATALLAELPPERNSLVTPWRRYGFEATDAFTSQALIQLRKEYCDRHRCSDCRYGSRFLRDHISDTDPDDL